jgi:hypothetical protein
MPLVPISCYSGGVVRHGGADESRLREGDAEVLGKVLHLMVASALVLVLVPAMAIAQTSAAQPVDPPPQVAQLRQQFEGLTTQQIEAQGYVPEGPCIPSPQGVGAMGIHAINQQLMQAQFPKAEMDPANPPILLVDGQSGRVIGLEWEAADVGQGPMKMFGQTIELQSGHPGVEQPHYMLHIYFKPDGKVLFGTNDQTAFDPELSCPPMSASATATATSTAAATATPTGTATTTALMDTGGMSLMPVLAVGALALLLTGGLMAAALVRRS